MRISLLSSHDCDRDEMMVWLRTGLRETELKLNNDGSEVSVNNLTVYSRRGDIFGGVNFPK